MWMCPSAGSSEKILLIFQTGIASGYRYPRHWAQGFRIMHHHWRGWKQARVWVRLLWPEMAFLDSIVRACQARQCLGVEYPIRSLLLRIYSTALSLSQTLSCFDSCFPHTPKQWTRLYVIIALMLFFCSLAISCESPTPCSWEQISLYTPILSFTLLCRLYVVIVNVRIRQWIYTICGTHTDMRCWMLHIVA